MLFPLKWMPRRLPGRPILLLACLAMGGGFPCGVARGQGATPDDEASGLPSEPRLRLIESLYRQGDSYRAESEILRLIRTEPRHPARPEAELVRAKLYHREGRFAESERMLLSLLDRYSRSPTAVPARRLLVFSQLRQGRYDEATALAPVLAAPGQDAPSLAEFSSPPPGAVDADAAKAWSTWLPGSGYFLLDEPGQAAGALTLNLALIGATVAFAQNDNPGAALVFLFLELLLWQGGRSGVHQDAQAFNRRLRERQADVWLEGQGEPALLRIGFQTRFGGR